MHRSQARPNENGAVLLLLAGLMLLLVPGAKTITPSRFHVPPRGAFASASVIGGPPDISILFNVPAEKKPIDLLSADQKG